MSDTLSFTFTNAGATLGCGFDFTATSLTTCSYRVNVNGGGFGSLVAVPDITSFPTINVATGSAVIEISLVSPQNTVTTFVINGGEPILTAVATTNTATWALGTAVNSFASTFAGCTTLTSVPNDIPATVTSLSNMFNDADAINDPNLSSWNTDFVTNMSGMFTQTNGVSSFNQNISSWNVRKVTTFANMFNNATNFNNGGVAMTWGSGGGIGNDPSVITISMNQMFLSAGQFNSDITSWNTSKVTNMSGMFQNTPFTQDISVWNVTAVTGFGNMFNGNTIFTAPVKYWTVGSATYSDMFLGSTAFNALYYGTTGYASPGQTLGSPSAAFFGQTRPERYPCFMRGTQILCYRAEEEVYLPIEDLRKGDLVKTFRNGYLPIHMIGTSSLSNPGDDERSTGRLYKCSKELYPGLFDDLYITGCHSILVPALTEDQWENTKDMLGDVYVTDNHFRLMACLDEKAQPFQKNSFIDIFHIALENEDYYMNYGVYANGLLVESCSKRYLTELSNMRIIGEDIACCDPEANVFSMMGQSIQIC